MRPVRPTYRTLAALTLAGWALALAFFMLPVRVMGLHGAMGFDGAKPLHDYHLSQRHRVNWHWGTQSDPAQTIYYIGDSMIAGVKPEGPTLNLGIGGDRAGWIAARLDDYPFLSQGRCVLMHVGINDLTTGTSPQDLADAWRTILERLGADTPVLASAILPIDEARFADLSSANNEKIQDANSRLEILCAARDNCRFIPAPRQLPAGHLMQDGLHLTPAGYDAWRTTLSTSLRDAGCRKGDGTVTRQDSW